jgi:hypothetical protein
MSAIALLADVKLEDVFQSTNESMNAGPGSTRLMVLLAGAGLMVLLLVVLQWRRKRQTLPKSVNHQGKLLKEIARPLGLKPAELKQLKELAEEAGLSSPLVLLLCPSLLGTAAQRRTSDQKKVLAAMVKRMGGR